MAVGLSIAGALHAPGGYRSALQSTQQTNWNLSIHSLNCELLCSVVSQYERESPFEKASPDVPPDDRTSTPKPPSPALRLISTLVLCFRISSFLTPPTPGKCCSFLQTPFPCAVLEIVNAEHSRRPSRSAHVCETMSANLLVTSSIMRDGCDGGNVGAALCRAAPTAHRFLCA